LVLDQATGVVSGIPVPASVGTGKYKWSGGVCVNGKLYGIPYQADQILVLDLTTKVVSGIPVPESVGSGIGKWSGGVVTVGKLIGIPSDADQILVLDLDTAAVSGVPVPASVGTGDYKWQGGVSVGGLVFGVPSDSEQILVVDPSLVVDLETALGKVGPLTLQCLDGTKFEVPWPAKVGQMRTVDLRKLAAQAHPQTVLQSGKFKLLVPGWLDTTEQPLDVSVVDADGLRQIACGAIPTTMTVAFEP
jgi:hypothetical protein